MPIVQVGKHTIEANASIWGTETVKYDGEVKAKGYSFFGRSYLFTMEEDGHEVTYEVEFIAGFLGAHFTVRRDGKAIFTS